MEWTSIYCFRGLIILSLTSLLALTYYMGMGASYEEDTFHKIMMESMVRMDRDMQNAPMTGDPDHDFAAMMVPHHQGAIDMAKAELLYGRDPVLRRLAQEIITTQNSEIQLMQQQLAKYQRRRESKIARHRAL